MKIIEKIQEKQKDLYARKPITIAFLGDSVTQGCFGCYEPMPREIDTDFVAEWAYCENVKKILNKLYPTVPFTIVNAGISGGSAYTGRQRLERDVLTYQPDLVVVCFGLNDSGGGEEGIKDYNTYLSEIFTQINASGAECIFMTPNTMNYNVSPKVGSDFFKEIASYFADRMKSGLMDKYVASGIAAAEANGVTVCDCYSLWIAMQNGGVNVTELLANKLNHPDKEMHYLFAYELVKTMLVK